MLIYGAYHPSARPLVLTIAGLSKLIFIGLVVVYGSQYLGPQVGLAIAAAWHLSACEHPVKDSQCSIER